MKNIQTLLLSVLLIFPLAVTLSQVRLPKLISDGMVIQRDTAIVIWGWAPAGEEVTVTFDGKQYRTMAGPEGKWDVELPAMKAGGPYTMEISGKNNMVLRDLLIGDVWLCSGQSNMVHQMDIHDVTYAEDIASADYPEIRHFKVPARNSLQGPLPDLDGGTWQRAVSEDVRPFSAVAYFFARHIYEKYRVPIGLVNASVGGTPAEAWISAEGLREFPGILSTVEKNRDTSYVNALLRNRPGSAGKEQQKTQDKGLTGPKPWYTVDYVPENWRRINIPGYWEDQGIKDMDGVVWYRKEIDIPRDMAGKEARLFLGRIVDADEVYINGQKIGNTTYQYPQRRYTVPGGLLEAGRNTFVVRVTNHHGKGGFVPDKPYYIFAGRDTVDLKGYWQYKVGEVFTPRHASGAERINPQNQPTALYNAMIAPFVNYPVRGVLWYQGESNAWYPENYRDLLTALVGDWRDKFNNPDMPFIYAQLPNFMEVDYSPSESNWAVLREAQLKALEVAHTAMTVNIDLGEWNDIHPDNKKDVGERMALAARKIAYGEDIVFSGPLYQSREIEGNKIIISFSHTGSGLVANDGRALSEFAIAGEDKNFVWAKARIEGNRVIVWNEDIPSPRYVRYAWADNPDNPNLYNREGLPASPFRTD